MVKEHTLGFQVYHICRDLLYDPGYAICLRMLQGHLPLGAAISKCHLDPQA